MVLDFSSFTLKGLLEDCVHPAHTSERRSMERVEGAGPEMSLKKMETTDLVVMVK